MKWNPYFVEKEINRLTKEIQALYDKYGLTAIFFMEDEKEIRKERKFIDREIEILENLLRIEEEKLKAITAYYSYQENDDDEPKSHTKKKGKTSPTLSHKQQIVLLNQLDFLNAPIFEEITIGEKAEILGNLLNRNIQETRELLTYFNDPKGTHEKFSNTLENQEVVGRLLEHNGLTFADKKE